MEKIIKQQHGFSLVEILVAFGLLSVLTLGIMKLFDNSSKTSKEIQNKDEITQLHQELTMILSNSTNCEANLGGRILNKDKDPKIIDPFEMGGVQSFLNGDRSSIHLVGPNRIEMDRRHKTTIVGARISHVDLNSSPGNNAIVDLEVTYEKPGVVFENPGDPNVTNNRIGSKTLTRIIKIGASLCPRTLHIGANQNLCPPGSNLVEGPTPTTNSQFWGICETCPINSVTTNSPIVSCHSIAAVGGEVNLDNLSATMCLRQGGTIDSSSGACVDKLTEPQCTALKGKWDTQTQTCDISQTNQSSGLTQLECEQLGGKWDSQKNPPCELKDKICEIEKQLFLQTKIPESEKTICGKKYKIIFKRQVFTKDTLNPIPIPAQGVTMNSSDVPNYDNIIQNTLALHLQGAGGGGGCGGTGVTKWGHGGYAGEKLVIPLDAINIQKGDEMLIDIGNGGVGGGKGEDCSVKNYIPLKGGFTRVTVIGKTQFKNYVTKIKATYIARGGEEGANEAISDKPQAMVNTSIGDYGCYGEPSNYLLTDDSNSNGGLCNLTSSKNAGGAGDVGSGGGGGYNQMGGRGGDGIVVLTWLEWEET
jgi:type II secretory pathway pseudopilin PulG